MCSTFIFTSIVTMVLNVTIFFIFSISFFKLFLTNFCIFIWFLLFLFWYLHFFLFKINYWHVLLWICKTFLHNPSLCVCLFSMLLNDHIVDIEKPGRICSSDDELFLWNGWLTKDLYTLFPAGTIRDSHHCQTLARHGQVSSLCRMWV